MGAVSVDTTINDETRNVLNASKSVLESDLQNRVKSDFSDFISLNLFKSQLNNLNEAIDKFIQSHTEFIKIIADNKLQWEEVDTQVQQAVNQYSQDVRSDRQNRSGGYGGNTGGGNGLRTSDGSETETIDHGNPVKPIDVKTLIEKTNEVTLCALIEKLYNLNKGSIAELLLDPEKSGVLVAMIRKILNEITDDDSRSDETDEIQKLLLEKLGITQEDITSDDADIIIDKKVMEKVEEAPEDNEKWDRLVYGDKTKTVDVNKTKYIVIDSATDPKSYSNYANSNGVSQDANVSEWGGKCLSFAETHAADMYKGSKSNGAYGAGYHAGNNFKSYYNDDKGETLAKIFEEIINGRPVVLQVNGNVITDKNGNRTASSRHYVTVVGFKEGVSQSSIKEEDLLIIDSWDAKLETMDTNKSRFMTNGKQCHKDYTGYMLRVYKA